MPALTSLLAQSNMEKHTTEIELAYSDFPEEEQLKLPLDSYAQIESLISHSSRPGTEREREMETGVWMGGETVFIT